MPPPRRVAERGRSNLFSSPKNCTAKLTLDSGTQIHSVSSLVRVPRSNPVWPCKKRFIRSFCDNLFHFVIKNQQLFTFLSLHITQCFPGPLVLWLYRQGLVERLHSFVNSALLFEAYPQITVYSGVIRFNFEGLAVLFGGLGEPF